MPGSDYHMRIGAAARLDSAVRRRRPIRDAAHSEVPADPLKFRDEKRYADRLKDARAKTGLHDAIGSATARSRACRSIVAVQDFAFMGGSLGMAAGEAIVAGCRAAVEQQDAASSCSPPPAARACRRASSR